MPHLTTMVAETQNSRGQFLAFPSPWRDWKKKSVLPFPVFDCIGYINRLQGMRDPNFYLRVSEIALS